MRKIWQFTLRPILELLCKNVCKQQTEKRKHKRKRNRAREQTAESEREREKHLQNENECEHESLKSFILISFFLFSDSITYFD